MGIAFVIEILFTAMHLPFPYSFQAWTLYDFLSLHSLLTHLASFHLIIIPKTTVIIIVPFQFLHKILETQSGWISKSIKRNHSCTGKIKHSWRHKVDSFSVRLPRSSFSFLFPSRALSFSLSYLYTRTHAHHVFDV